MNDSEKQGFPEDNADEGIPDIEKEPQGRWNDRGSALEEKLTGFRDTLPNTSQALFWKAAHNSASPKQAIKAMCQQCMGYEDFRVRVKECPVWKCPLWTYRPYQG